MWVFLGHTGGPYFIPDNRFETIFRSLFWLCINPPAAVIVFFLISGFCIHFPWRDPARVEQINLGAFYTRRLARIFLPAIAAVALTFALGYKPNAYGIQGTPLWSIVCEIIYYIIYPVVILPLRRRFGWSPLLIGTFLIGFAIAAMFPKATNYTDPGIYLTWLLALPCWLLGCALAERSDKLTAETPQRLPIWLWRIGILLSSILVSVLCHHLPGGIHTTLPWILNLFAIIVFFWLTQEIIENRKRKPNAILESAGAWSYSLYLVHVPALLAINSLNLAQYGMSDVPRWLLKISVGIAASYLFYRLIEHPAQRLAVAMCKKIA